MYGNDTHIVIHNLDGKENGQKKKDKMRLEISTCEVCRWVTYHGLAVNVAMDTSPYSFITPCGISDRPIGTIQTSLLDGSSAAERAQGLAGDDLLLQEYRVALIDSLECVFSMRSMDASIEDVIVSET